MSTVSGDQHGEHAKAKATAWAAVILMLVGFALCVLALPWQEERLPLLVVGGIVGLAGVVLGAVTGIMEQTE